MAFEVYVPQTRRRNSGSTNNKKPAVTLSRETLVLNKWAREILQSDKLELAFNTGTNTIRIRPAEGDTAVLLRKTKITAKGFYNQFRISQKGFYPATEVNREERILFVKL